MARILLKVVCFCMFTSFLALASEKPYEAELKSSEAVKEEPRTLSLFPTPQQETPAITGSPKDKMLGESDTKTKTGCCSCAKNEEISKREDKVKAARLSMLTDVLIDKLQLQPKDLVLSESGRKEDQGEVELSKLPQGLLDQVQDVQQEEYYAWEKQTIQSGHNCK
ncbi:hypothetical protein ElyMa_001493600 [Elysia marginata]|uniref:Uncharacterized protein n=1 Tax=Elysia marginata TaxID=1093978 RepID=A0AAV4J3A3_9GAST|nr:hypothetical protein ElyMa_001493600 [Elysia marginata]